MVLTLDAHGRKTTSNEGGFEHQVLYEFKGAIFVKKRLHFTHTGWQKSSNRRRKTRAKFDYALLA
jgi:hypothetical protein